MKLLKSARVAVALLVVVVAAIAVVTFMRNDAPSVVETVEALAGRALGTRVDVDGAEMDWSAGELSLSGLAVANPGGFSDREMITVDKIDVRGDLRERSVERVRFSGIVAAIEFRGATSNFEALSDRMADAPGTGEGGGAADGTDDVQDDEPDDPGTGGGTERGKWTVKRVDFEDIRVTVSADWTSRVAEIETGGLSLESVAGETEDMARSATMEFLVNVLSKAAGQVEDDRLKKILLEKAGELRDRMPGAGQSGQ